MNQNGVGVRLFVGGGAEAKRDFREFRDEGKRAFSEIAGGARAANPALLAFSRTVNEGREGVSGLAEGTGAAGRVLSAFGVAGIGFAAVLGGIGVAAHQAREALAFADEIGDAAGKLDVTTDYLQQMRYAVHATGGEFTDADAALQGFTKALGGAESGLSPKLLKAFQGLGFSKEDLAAMKGDIPSALEVVADRISKLGTEAERAAVADKLGLTPMLPLLRSGADHMAELREEAAKLGFVMDSDLVATAGDANDKLEVMSQVIDVQLKSAFVNLAPEVLGVTQAVTDLLRSLNGFSNNPGVQSILRVSGAFLKGGYVGMTKAALAEGDRNIVGMAQRDMYGALPENWTDEDSPDAIRAAYLTKRGKAQGSTSLTVPGKSGGAKKAAAPKGTPTTPIELQTAIDPRTGDYLKSRSAADWAYNDFMGYFPGEEPKAKKLAVDVDVESVNDKLAPWFDETRENVKDTFSGGIMAAFDGHLGDFIKQRLVGSLADGLAESLTKALMSATNNGLSGGGGIGGAILSGVGALFGRHAIGGRGRPGEIASVAEYGEEMALFGREGQVFSHEDTVRMLQDAVGGGRSAAPSVKMTYAPVYNVQGSGPELDRLRSEMKRDQETFHGRVIGSVNTAIDRRQIKQGR